MRWKTSAKVAGIVTGILVLLMAAVDVTWLPHGGDWMLPKIMLTIGLLVGFPFAMLLENSDRF